MFIPVLSCLMLQATTLELNVNMAVRAVANRSDIHRLQTELSRLTKCNLTQSSFVTQMKERYLYLLKSNYEEEKMVRTKHLYGRKSMWYCRSRQIGRIYHRWFNIYCANAWLRSSPHFSHMPLFYMYSLLALALWS